MHLVNLSSFRNLADQMSLLRWVPTACDHPGSLVSLWRLGMCGIKCEGAQHWHSCLSIFTHLQLWRGGRLSFESQVWSLELWGAGGRGDTRHCNVPPWELDQEHFWTHLGFLLQILIWQDPKSWCIDFCQDRTSSLTLKLCLVWGRKRVCFGLDNKLCCHFPGTECSPYVSQHYWKKKSVGTFCMEVHPNNHLYLLGTANVTWLSRLIPISFQKCFSFCLLNRKLKAWAKLDEGFGTWAASWLGGHVLILSETKPICIWWIWSRNVTVSVCWSEIGCVHDVLHSGEERRSPW